MCANFWKNCKQHGLYLVHYLAASGHCIALVLFNNQHNIITENKSCSNVLFFYCGHCIRVPCFHFITILFLLFPWHKTEHFLVYGWNYKAAWVLFLLQLACEKNKALLQFSLVQCSSFLFAFSWLKAISQCHRLHGVVQPENEKK